MFSALRIHQRGETRRVAIDRVSEDELPEGTVTVAVHYSSLNYKDGLAVTGKGKIIRGDFPFVPGIDLVGEVVDSGDHRFAVGDKVVATGGGLGETIWGGYSQLARPNPDYMVKLPDDLSPERAMAMGTAGFTAMLSVMTLERENVDSSGEVAVTGATGGVGSIALALLARRGFDVVASTGSDDAHAYLRRLGAQRIISRDELGGGPARPLDSSRWSGAVDTVGGATLSAILSQLGWHGTVAVCGNAGGHELHTTVFPFILRGVKMMGIDSNTSPRAERETAWEQLAAFASEDVLSEMYKVIELEEVEHASRRILRGDVRGRIVVKVGT